MKTHIANPFRSVLCVETMYRRKVNSDTVKTTEIAEEIKDMTRVIIENN